MTTKTAEHGWPFNARAFLACIGIGLVTAWGVGAPPFAAALGAWMTFVAGVDQICNTIKNNPRR